MESPCSSVGCSACIFTPSNVDIVVLVVDIEAEANELDDMVVDT